MLSVESWNVVDGGHSISGSQAVPTRIIRSKFFIKFNCHHISKVEPDLWIDNATSKFFMRAHHTLKIGVRYIIATKFRSVASLHPSIKVGLGTTVRYTITV